LKGVASVLEHAAIERNKTMVIIGRVRVAEEIGDRDKRRQLRPEDDKPSSMRMFIRDDG